MIVYKIQRFSFPVFTNNYLNIIWYSFYKGRLFILLFTSWISYSTISNYHGVVLVINKEPDIILGWKKLTQQQWETTFLATHYDLTRTGGLHSDGSWAMPHAAITHEAIQRPALYRLDNYGKYHSCI